MSGNSALLGPFQDGAGLDLQVLRGLRCCEPFGHLFKSPFPGASPHPRCFKWGQNLGRTWTEPPANPGQTIPKPPLFSTCVAFCYPKYIIFHILS